MGSNERRERERQETRTKILDAARELFAAHGFEAVTMRKIAEKVEYTPTALYFHFADKETLIRELCVHDFYVFGEEVAKLMNIEDPIERLRTLGREYARFAINHPQHYRIMFMTPTVLTSECQEWKGDPAHDAYAFLRWTMQEAIDKGRVRPEFNDADLAAQVAWSAIHGVVSLQITKGNDPWVAWVDFERRVAVACDALIWGVEKKPDNEKAKK